MNSPKTNTVIALDGVLMRGVAASLSAGFAASLAASFAASLALGLTRGAHAGQFDAETRVVGSDTADTDRFGWSVAISGNIAVVGAATNGNPVHDCGSGYLFDASTGAEFFKLTAEDAGGSDRLGVSVAISGNTAIVGADSDDDAGSASGSAYLFDVTTGDQTFKLTADDAELGDLFGTSVGISGDVAIVGSPKDDDACPGNPVCDSGSAYLFDVTTGNQLFKLTASGTDLGDQFGTSVAISGNTAIVGAPGNDGSGGNSGAAYLFDVTTGDQLFTILASDSSAFDNFGASVAISGNTAIVGAWGDDAPGADSGTAYLFDVATGVERFKLTASDASHLDRFGWSVAIDGDTAIVGAYQTDQGCPPEFPNCNTGAAYVFDVATGGELAKLSASDADAGDEFGTSVGISGTTAIAGSWQDGTNNSGSAYLFGESSDPDLTWYSVDCGGGVSIGGGFEMTSVLGQPDAGLMSGASAGPSDAVDYSVTGGLLGIIRAPAPPCPADVDGDGAVAFGDLLALLSAWGPCEGCPEDIDESGAVDFGDILAVLSAWGPCP